MARPKKLVDAQTGHLTKEQIAEKKDQEEALEQLTPLDVDDVPKWLDTRGKKEWKRIAPLMQELPISELDRQMLAMYCNYVSIYEQCAKALKKEGLTIVEMGSKGQAITKQNVHFQTMLQTSKEIKNIASTMGLTLDSRLRILVPERESANADPFADLLND